MSNWMGKADLHIHTCHSDGAPTVRELLDHVALRTTLNVIAITDHDTISGALEAREMLRQEEYPFEVIVGEEVSTRDGHLVGLFLHERIAPGLSAAQTVDEIHAQGGLAFAPHPFFRAQQGEDRPVTMVGLGEIIKDLPLDAVETINNTPFLQSANRRAAEYNASVTRLPSLGNSDGHIVEAVGKGYTSFPGQTAYDLRTAVLDGLTMACSRAYRLDELWTYLRFWLDRPRHWKKGQQGAVLSELTNAATAIIQSSRAATLSGEDESVVLPGATRRMS